MDSSLRIVETGSVERALHAKIVKAGTLEMAVGGFRKALACRVHQIITSTAQKTQVAYPLTHTSTHTHTHTHIHTQFLHAYIDFAAKTQKT